MGNRRPPLPVKFFAGILLNDPVLIQDSIRIMESHFGPTDLRGSLRPWVHTDYYKKEMGHPLFRTFIFFEHLRPPDDLLRLKLHTLSLEEKFGQFIAGGVVRKVNIDPGYLTEAKVVLATTKDFSHRLYIGEGIYAEVTLCYNRDEQSFHAVGHTYPDFRLLETIELFNDARIVLRTGLGRGI